MKALIRTDFHFPDQVSKYTGKVRDVYALGSNYMVMVVTDRISAFDVVLPEGLEFIGEDMFRDCPGLRRLVIPSTVKRIIPWTVSDSPVFEGIACHSPLFRVEGEALIRNADDAMLCCWTRSERYAVPSGVRRLDGFGSGSVRILTCDHPLEGIGYDCFGGCESLKEVSLQAVGEIADSAFFGLTDVKVTVDGKPYPIPRDDEGIAMRPYFPYQG